MISLLYITYFPLVRYSIGRLW